MWRSRNSLANVLRLWFKWSKTCHMINKVYLTPSTLTIYSLVSNYSVSSRIADTQVQELYGKSCSKRLPAVVRKRYVKKIRGFFESRVCKSDDIIITRWVDNAVVTMASTGHGELPLSSVQRYSQAEKKRIYVSRPFNIGEYNEYMGITYRMEEHISLYRIGIRDKKWGWSLFTWPIDISVNNTWVLTKAARSDLPQL